MYGLVQRARRTKASGGVQKIQAAMLATARDGDKLYLRVALP
jgi:hypothetical protein